MLLVGSRKVILFCLFAVFLPSGCALWSRSANVPLTVTPTALVTERHVDAPLITANAGNLVNYKLISADFVNAMQQIPSLSPARTTIEFSGDKRRDAFTLMIRDEVERAGYRVRWISDAAGATLFHYREEKEREGAAGVRTRYDVAIGKVEMRRAYHKSKGRPLQPATPLYVRGADASQVSLNDGLFSASTHQSNPTKDTTARVSPSIQLPVEANPLDERVISAIDANKVTLPAVALPAVQNVFELGQSNYKNQLAEHRVVEDLVLAFANDSLRLGVANKQLIGQFLKRFDPVVDILSVVGCSQGPTRVKGGNAALALGRASRVREALLFSGVAPEKILYEGCWAGDNGIRELPARGVVITLNRQV